MDDTVRCNQCGGDSPAESRFCIECGAALAPAATGPTTRLEEPHSYTSARTATPRPPMAKPAHRPIIIAPPLPPPFQRPRHGASGGRAPDFTAPFVIIAVALAILFVPRFGGSAVMAIGVGGLLLRGVLRRPDRVLPLLALLALGALLFTGSKLLIPAMFVLFVAAAIFRGRGWPF